MVPWTTILLCVHGCAQLPRAPLCGPDGLAAKLEAKLPRHKDFGYGTSEVIALSDLQTKQLRRVCILQGGPTYEQDGGVGLFDDAGRLVDWRRIQGLEDYIEATARIRGTSYLPDSVVLRTLIRSGTGLHEDSLVVLTIVSGRLVETFQGVGDLVEISPGIEERRAVRLAFVSLHDCEFNEIVSMVYTLKNDRSTTSSTVYSYNALSRHFE